MRMCVCVWSVACRCLEWMGWTLVCTWRIRLVRETPWAGDIIACTSYTAARVANTSRCSDARSAPAERTETNMVTTHTHTHTHMSHSSSKHRWERLATHTDTHTGNRKSRRQRLSYCWYSDLQTGEREKKTPMNSVFLYCRFLLKFQEKHLTLKGSVWFYMKSSDAKPSKCHLKFSSLMMIFIKLVYLSSVISLK